MSAQLVEIQGQNCLLSTLHDITELQRLHEGILAAQKLADLGTLAAGVAHEINSPLQVITGISDSLTLRLDQALKDPDSLRRRLDTIKRNAWRCAEIVRALLAYSRSSLPQAGAHDLNAVIGDSLLLIEHQLRSWSNITVLTDLADELPLIACDRNQITQVLINLLTNARDAMLTGGEVTIRTYCQAGTDEVCLSVSDNGIGISKDVQSRIFDPFYTTKPLGRGTGLGLSIVNGIVRSHHGTIELQSEPGRGTTFTLRFPTAASDSKVVPTPLNPADSPFDDSIGPWPKPAGSRPWW